MKKVLVASAVAMLAVPAFAEEIKLPTIYGQLNKAIHYVSQKKEMKYTKVSNLVDVKNAESRLGAKGTHEINTLKVNYNLAIGMDSSNDTDGTGAGRIRVRTAEVSFVDAWGTIFAGQTSDLVANLGYGLDPLATTFAGTTGVDQPSYIKNATGSLGYIDRGRNDQIGYKTPEFMGFKYSVATTKIAISGTADEALDNNSIVPGTATTAATHPGTRYVNLLSYNHTFNDMLKMEAHIGYDLLKSSWYKTYNDYLGAASVTYGEFTLAGEYSKMNRQRTTANAYKMKNTMIQSSVKWARGDHTVAVTFANRKNEEAAKTSTTGSQNGKYNQIAAGYMYNLNKYVQLRGVYAHYTTDTENTSKNTNSTDTTPFKNTADVFSLGALVTF